MIKRLARTAAASALTLWLCGHAGAGAYAFAAEQGCMSFVDHDRSLQHATRLYGRGAILTHNAHPPVRDRCEPSAPLRAKKRQ